MSGPQPSGSCKTCCSTISWTLVPLVALLDQLSKKWIIGRFELWESETVIGDFFKLTRVHNPGAAFGMLRNHPELFMYLTSFAILALFFHKLTTKNRSLLYQTALSFVLGGAIGNIIDRFHYNYVIDFIDIGFGATRWPSFNVADSAITIGVGLLLLASGPNKAEIAIEVEEPQKNPCSL